jgi:hypothetical protein
MLALIGRGLSDAELAAEHGLSPATAQKHRSNLLRKLGVVGSAKVTADAIELGFARFGPIRPGPWLGPTAALLPLWLSDAVLRLGDIVRATEPAWA